MATIGLRPGRSQGRMTQGRTAINPFSTAGNEATGYRATGARSAPAAAVAQDRPQAGSALGSFSMPSQQKGPSLGEQLGTTIGTKLASDLAGKAVNSGWDYLTSPGSSVPQSSLDAANASTDPIGSLVETQEWSAEPAYAGDDAGGFDSYAEPDAGGFEAGTLDTSAVAEDPSWFDSLMGFANGGLLPGHTEGEDGIPMMADGGEYVIPTDVVDQLGPEFFEQLIEALHRPVPGKAPTRGALNKFTADDYPSPVRFGG